MTRPTAPIKGILLLTLLCLCFRLLAASPVWKIEHGASRLYLAGTVHLLRDTDYPLPAAFEAAYRDAEILAFEVDIDSTQGHEFQRLLARSVLLPPSTRLSDLLRDDTLQQLEDYLNANRMGLARFQRLKPGMLATSLTMQELGKLGVNSEGVDAYYYAKARADAKTILALETAQEQIRLLTGMGKDNPDELILRTLQEIRSLESDFAAMLEAWRRGDSVKLQELFIDPMRLQFESIYRELLVDRNTRWLESLRDWLDTPQTEMVLVGSAHLVGQDGLITRLQAAGFSVTQLD